MNNSTVGVGHQFFQNHLTELTLRGNTNLQELISPESKVSSLLESPPPVTDPSPDKGIKDFNTQYLNQGMWPSKLNSNVHEYQIKSNTARVTN